MSGGGGGAGLLTAAELDGRVGLAAAGGDPERVGDADVVPRGAPERAVGDVAEAEGVGVEGGLVRCAARGRGRRRTAVHEAPALHQAGQRVAAVLLQLRLRRRGHQRRGEEGRRGEEEEEGKLARRRHGIAGFRDYWSLVRGYVCLFAWHDGVPYLIYIVRI
jgi:hypothetical protein